MPDLCAMHTLAQLRAGQLAGHTRLDLSEGLTEFPPEIFDLADSLEILNLSGNALSALPPDFGRLRKLRVLFCSDNQFTEVPAVLGQCPQLSIVGFKANQIHTLPAGALTPALRWLILTDNRLEALLPELGNCLRLQKLMLAGNHLTHLPDALANCRNLELLRLAANRLEALPAWLPQLPRLAWLAYAGNPFCAQTEVEIEARHPIATIDWNDLALEEQLGEGASGVIYRARWRPGPDQPPQAVAVKIFRGTVTSDGLPHSEIAACISAGAHPNLIPIAGKVTHHPAGAEGLVMALIDPAFGNLAGPPSLATCTRDVYTPGTAFGLAAVLRLARGVASAGAHLHAQGILHGDLYAHNILHAADGTALLGDFGAACFFDPASPGGPALQRLEVRAFACLLEELLAHCNAPATSQVVRALRELQRRCGQPKVAARPLFTEVMEALAAAGSSGRQRAVRAPEQSLEQSPGTDSAA